MSHDQFISCTCLQFLFKHIRRILSDAASLKRRGVREDIAGRDLQIIIAQKMGLQSTLIGRYVERAIVFKKRLIVYCHDNRNLLKTLLNS